MSTHTISLWRSPSRIPFFPLHCLRSCYCFWCLFLDSDAKSGLRLGSGHYFVHFFCRVLVKSEETTSNWYKWLLCKCVRVPSWCKRVFIIVSDDACVMPEYERECVSLLSYWNVMWVWLYLILIDFFSLFSLFLFYLAFCLCRCRAGSKAMSLTANN